MFQRQLLTPVLAPLLRQRRFCQVLTVGAFLIWAAQMRGWGLWSCPSASLFSLPCPGCGLTRGLESLFHGRWSEMLQMHPFAPPVLILGLIVALTALAPPAQTAYVAAKVEALERRTGLVAVILMLWLGFGLGRMIGLFDRPPMPAPIFQKFRSSSELLGT